MKAKDWKLLSREKISIKTDKKKVIRILLDNRRIPDVDKEKFVHLAKPAEITPAMAGLKKTDLTKAKRLIEKTAGKIIVYGDYDADGLCATAVLWQSLWQKGFDVLPFIPDREQDGYGIKKKTVGKLKEVYPDLKLIITVDNGIVAHEAVEYAKSLGLKVIITDHHLIESKKPAADVIIHTTQLSGAGVAWFLALQFGYRSLELNAIGTIADTLPLTGVNRIFAYYGLKELTDTKSVGLCSLKKSAGLTGPILPWHIYFALGPRLNAIGRLVQPIDALRLLCTGSFKKAADLSAKLEKANGERQKLTLDIFDHARSVSVSSKEKIIVVAHSSYHQGVVGLVAGKLADEFYRPAIVIWRGRKISKGSARSVAGVNIAAMIKKLNRLLVSVGGHPMAAGFTIETKNINEFNREIKKIAQKISPAKLVPKITIDFEVGFSVLNRNFYNLLQKLSPFGFGNPEPTFLIKNVQVVDLKNMGKKSEHLKLYLDNPDTSVEERVVAEAVCFGGGEKGKEISAGDLLDIVFNLDLNCWRGKEIIQLKIKDWRKSS